MSVGTRSGVGFRTVWDAFTVPNIGSVTPLMIQPSIIEGEGRYYKTSTSR